MKKICLAFSLFFAFQNFLSAQEASSKSAYKTLFYLQKPPMTLDAKIEQLKDSSILVSSAAKPALGKFDIPVTRISEIHWREKGKTGRGIATGAAIGFSLGFIIGFGTTRSDPSDFIYVSPAAIGLGVGLVGGLAGGITGGIVSSFDTSIPISGSQTKYEQQKERLRQIMEYRQ